MLISLHLVLGRYAFASGNIIVLSFSKILFSSPLPDVIQVLHVAHDFAENDILEARGGDQSDPHRGTSQRKAFLRELDAMIRLRSPHTVNLYGAVTSRPDRLVIIMELLATDLRAVLKKSTGPLPEEQSRRIVGDICAGMAFLHGRETVHGDLKSANVLLDGAGRAKVRADAVQEGDATFGRAISRPGKKPATQGKAAVCLGFKGHPRAPAAPRFSRRAAPRHDLHVFWRGERHWHP